MFIIVLCDMTNFNNLIVFFALFAIKSIKANVFNELINQKDPCVALCEKIPLSTSLTSTEPLLSDSAATKKSCCQRGCRFFNLVDLVDGPENKELNDTKNACESSCTEAYIDREDRSACIMGCTYMAKQRILDLVSILSAALSTEDDLIIPHHLLVISLDMPDNAMSDPGLKKEIFPGWWDSEGFKLPQTFIKSVPQDSTVMDYSISPDYSGEVEQTISMPGANWLQCVSRHTGIPRWVLSSFIITGALAALWLCFVSEKTTEIPDKSISDNNNDLSKVTLIYPNDKAPPVYTEFHETEDKKLIV
ncbi:transmembrane protein 59-like [Chelonus insularis]|uniref:transmembrane protein 59-like n=1 Tax=Chelonus insularis TaxID=460826 RepID=UPI00158974DD|nr:transmembrane protein 59-like [Chelonus insularis]